VKIPSGAGWQFASENSSATSQASMKATLPSEKHWKLKKNIRANNVFCPRAQSARRT
jgi:hypothetical protein